MSIETDRLIDIYASRIADVFNGFGAENTSKRKAARAALAAHIEMIERDAMDAIDYRGMSALVKSRGFKSLEQVVGEAVASKDNPPASGNVPEGFVSVPVEPTEAMLAAFDANDPPMGPPEKLTEEYAKRWRERRHRANAAIWKAMLKAAP